MQRPLVARVGFRLTLYVKFRRAVGRREAQTSTSRKPSDDVRQASMSLHLKLVEVGARSLAVSGALQDAAKQFHGITTVNYSPHGSADGLFSTLTSFPFADIDMGRRCWTNYNQHLDSLEDWTCGCKAQERTKRGRVQPSWPWLERLQDTAWSRCHAGSSVRCARCFCSMLLNDSNTFDSMGTAGFQALVCADALLGSSEPQCVHCTVQAESDFTVWASQRHGRKPDPAAPSNLHVEPQGEGRSSSSPASRAGAGLS